MSDARRPDGREVRDALVADYQSYARRKGVDVSTRDLETIAISDLVITDRVEAETKVAPPRKPVEAAPKTEPSRAEKLATSRGYTFGKIALPARDPVKRKPPPLLEKPRALAKRMAQMCQQVPGSPKGASLADRQYVYPAFAKDVLTEHTDFTYKRRKYRGLSYLDRQRVFWRAIEDIADRSTGVLGPWWVR